MASVGSFKEFDSAVETWASYVERLDQYFVLNDVTNEKKVAAILSLMGPQTYGLLKDIVFPTPPREKSYQDIVNALRNHFSPRPLKIAERSSLQAEIS